MQRFIKERGMRFLAPVAVLLVGIALSLALFTYIRDDLQRDAELRFERQASDAKHIIERRLRGYTEVTHGLKALFDAQESVSRAEFHRYVASLRLKEQYPGFVQLNYARHVAGGERQFLEAQVRGDRSLAPRGYPDFSVRPAGEREHHHVLIYIEPMEGNEYSFGLDILMIGLRGQAMDNLRESTSVISSGRPLVLGDPPFIGIGVRLPLYRAGLPRATAEQRRAAFSGSVGAGINVRYLMTGVLDKTTMTGMRYRVHDAGPVGSAGQESRLTLIYDSAQPGPGAPKDHFETPGSGATFGVALPLEFAGRDWKLHFSAPQSAFLKRTDSELPWMALAAGVLLSLLLFAVILSFAAARERAVVLAEEISARAVEAQRANASQIRDLLRRLVFAQETERRRLSADLHDLVGQSLTVIGMGIETLRSLLARSVPGSADATFDEMSKLLKETMGSVRAVMSDLRPPLLDDYGLYAAIEWHVRQMATRTGLQVEIGGAKLEPRPAAEVEVALFRIAQEALTNVVKHAGATRARISLTRDAGQVQLVVEDDGCGISSAANDAEAIGWGMAVMRERAAAVGGAMRVESRERGTRIVVEVAA